MIILPSEVFILGHRYEIHKMSRELHKEREAYGDCCNEKKVIRIFCEMALSTVRDTLLHEILHAVWDLNYLAEREEEEKVVCRLSTSLIGILDDPRNLPVKQFLFCNYTDSPQEGDTHEIL